MIGFRKQRQSTTRPGSHNYAPKGKTAVVVGGGLGGVAAATVLAERGVSVTVVEKEHFLGGRAGAWTETLKDGTTFEMERGFHGFFRQYYNVRELIRRVDPTLSCLVKLEDYPLLGPGGHEESFSNLPKMAPFNVVELVRRTDTLGVVDLAKVGALPALAMLAYDTERTFEKYDRMTAREYLDSLKFPKEARQMLFDVFSHSFFNPEDDYSAAELLMNFHFYFMGNPEGLVFDVMNRPFSHAFFRPMEAYLARRGVSFRMGEAASHVVVEGDEATGVVLESGETIEADMVVLSVTVPALKAITEKTVIASGKKLIEGADELQVTWPFAVWRLWVDKPCRDDRAPFAGTAGLGILDNISLYHLFEDESRDWVAENGGAVIELHAYAVPPTMSEDEIKADLLEQLHAAYPETVGMTILEDRYLHRRDCPSFEPGNWSHRPPVETSIANVKLAGDFVKTSFPSALMERAVATGFIAANQLLAPFDVVEEPIYSVPTKGLLARRSLRAPWRKRAVDGASPPPL